MSVPNAKSPEESGTPTAIRYLVLVTAFLVAVLLYLHRFILTYAEPFIREDLGVSDSQIQTAQTAFFLAYALAQVPSGGLADRFGSRRMLTLYILIWAGFTVTMGLVTGFAGLILVRMAVGLGQAGAYPTCAAVVRNWAPFSIRAFVSSLIALGGRVGGALAPIIVSLLIVNMVPPATPESSLLSSRDLLHPGYLVEQLAIASHPTTSPVAEELASRFLAAQRLAGRLPAELLSNAARPGRKFGDKPEPGEEVWSDTRIETLTQAINQTLTGPLLLQENEATSLPVEKEARRLWGQSTLTDPERTRLNRLVLEATCSAGVRKVYGNGWRSVVMLLGSLGLVVALGWYVIVRNRPEDHPNVNQAECDLIALGTPQISTTRMEFPWKALLSSPSLWNLSISQFCNNVGWVFLVTLLPRYLQEVHQVPFEKRSFLASVPLWIGWFGMISGGWATDRLTKTMGLRIGRSWPLGISRFVGGAAFAGFLLHPDAITATILFSVVAFTTDFSAPPMWAYSQDVGGRYTAAILGWSNMWGNLGAALLPRISGRLLGESKDQWDRVFLVCCAAFLIAGVTGMFVDATKKIEQESSPTPQP